MEQLHPNSKRAGFLGAQPLSGVWGVPTLPFPPKDGTLHSSERISHMGVERAVTRWYVQRQRITDEIAALEAKLAQAQAGQHSLGDVVEQRIDTEKQLAALHAKLHTLGPCPKPMMG